MTKQLVKKESAWVRTIKKSGVYLALEKVADDQIIQIRGLTKENNRMAGLVDQKLHNQLMADFAPDTMDIVKGGEVVTRKMDLREREMSAVVAMATMSTTPLIERLQDARSRKLTGNLNRAVEVTTDIEADLIQIKILSDELIQFKPDLPVGKEINDLATRAQRRLKMIYPESDR